MEDQDVQNPQISLLKTCRESMTIGAFLTSKF